MSRSARVRSSFAHKLPRNGGGCFEFQRERLVRILPILAVHAAAFLCTRARGMTGDLIAVPANASDGRVGRPRRRF